MNTLRDITKPRRSKMRKFFQRLCVADEILAKIEEAGFTVAMQKLLHLSKEQAEEFYSEHRDEAYFDELTTTMSRCGPNLVRKNTQRVLLFFFCVCVKPNEDAIFVVFIRRVEPLRLDNVKAEATRPRPDDLLA